MAEITLYTDGACSGNPGPGGFGVVLMSGQHRKELSAGFLHTTNNRMELMAVIAGLEALKGEGHSVTVFSDSKYVVDAFLKNWIAGWRARRFEKVKNPDLWMRLLRAVQPHQVRFVWVKGHAENPHNNRCDELAVQASKSNHLLKDL
jgi:ribonuclease HI